jgi:photosystem II stability/assembly factor-like uncharacterized protein
MKEVRIQNSEISSLRFFASLRLCVTLLFLSVAASAQWVKQNVDTTASLRGLSVVNEKIVWASGTGGTVIRTIDGGKTWKVIAVPGAEKHDFRDIEAFDANTAYILSIGNGESSRIYKTTDGGKTWTLQFSNTNEKAFFDAIACWDRNDCIAMSDPVGQQFLVISTQDGGQNWLGRAGENPPAAVEGEAAFAASGTCLIVSGKTIVHIVSGGKDARVFRSDDHGGNWHVARSPIVNGASGSGIFSIAMFDLRSGVIVGGNYEKPDDAKNNLALTTDGGQTWKLGTGLTGYRSGVTYIDRKTIIAVGTNGSDITRDGGKTWKVLGKENLNAVQAKGRRAVWAVGPKGLVVKMK